MRTFVCAATAALFLCALAPVASAHTTGPTNLIVKSTTETSVSLDWTQEYRDSYDGYYVRVDGGPRVKYSSSEGTVTGLGSGSSYQFCVTINFTSTTHPDESDQTCVTATTAGTSAPSPSPSPSPSPTATATPTPTPTPTPTDTTTAPSPAPVPAAKTSYPRFVWTRSSSLQAEFDQVKALGFTHAMVNPDPVQLAKVANAGLRAVLWGGNYDDINCVWRWSDAAFAQKVQDAKASPFSGLIDYVFVADEPHSASSGGCASSPQQMRARVALSKSLLPDAPTIISENRAADFKNLANIADVFAPIRYPCSYAKGCVLSKIDDHVAALKAAGITNWWAVPQTFREPSTGYYRAPNATEMQAILTRWQSFAPKGLLTYAWGDSCCGDDIGLRELPDLWPVLRRFNG